MTEAIRKTSQTVSNAISTGSSKVLLETIPILAMSGMHHGHKTADFATSSQHFYVLRKDMAFILFVVDGRMDNNQQIAKSARY